MEPQEFASVRNEVARRPGLDGPGRRAALTEVTDAWVQELFPRACAATSQPMCLIAVGGYGRGDLTLGSDLDLVLLHSGRGGGLSDLLGGGQASANAAGSTVMERNLDRLTIVVALVFVFTTMGTALLLDL